MGLTPPHIQAALLGAEREIRHAGKLTQQEVKDAQQKPKVRRGLRGATACLTLEGGPGLKGCEAGPKR